MITLSRFQRLLIYLFVFFGPLGTLLTPSFMPYAFRFYHFFLVLFPLFYLKLHDKEWKTALSFVPFIVYCLISAYFTHNKEFHRDAYPLFRCFLFASQCLFMFGAAFCLKGRNESSRLIRIYLAGFFLSLIVGYIFYIGFYLGKISFATLYRYSVETQMGWGLLRFSPGTYPNEYGIISSFALSALLIKFAEKKKFLTLSFACATFLAFLLTTTRAAYLSYSISLIYLLITSKEIRKLMTKLGLATLAILLILKAYSIDFFKIFIAGVKTISFTYGSTGIRFKEWIKGFEDLNESLFFGSGFSTNIHAHNVYLELLFEVGLIGAVILGVTLVYYFSTNGHRMSLFFRNYKKYPHIIVGLIHVFSFAATNHNMHHHLTWFVFLLFNMHLFSNLKGDEDVSLSKQHPSQSALQL
jgi:O-antigen ligase